MKAAVYLRQSEDLKDDRLAISRQREDCHALCAQRGWEPIDYVDNDLSALGPKRKRPAWDQMLADLADGTVDAMVCWDLDRLYREPIDLEYLIPLADRRGIPLATVTGDVDLSTDNGRMFARIKGAVAKSEAERRSARQRRRFKQMAEAGEPWLSHRPFGYELDGITVIPAEAAAVRKACELILARHSVASVRRAWTESGIRTTRGNLFTHNTQVRVILMNPRNAGHRVYRGEIVGPGTWPAIVEDDLWRAVCDILGDPGRRPSVPNARKFLTTGIARCGKCGNTLKAHVRRTKDVDTRTLRCDICFKVTRLLAPIEELVRAQVIDRLAQPDAAELLVDIKRPDVEALRQEAAVLRERLDTFAVDYAEGLISRDQLRVGTARVQKNLDQVERQMTDVNKARLFGGIVGAEAERFREVALPRQRAIVDALMTITVHPALRKGVFDLDTVVIEWKETS